MTGTGLTRYRVPDALAEEAKVAGMGGGASEGLLSSEQPQEEAGSSSSPCKVGRGRRKAWALGVGAAGRAWRGLGGAGSR